MTFLALRSVLVTTTPFALVSALHASAWAQPPEDTTLAPVIVTASRIGQPQTEALPHTTIITAAEISRRQATDLPSLLRQEAGLQFTRNGGPGQPSSLFMRGTQPAETLILLDGVPVRREGFSAAPALENILPEQIERIEIVRGNVSAIYGTGAIGGVIQIFTKQGSTQPLMSLSAEAGARGTFKLTGSLSGKVESTRYALSMTKFRTDGFSANSTSQYPNESPDNDGYRNTSVAGTLVNEWATGHEVGVRIYSNDGKYTFDGGGFGTPTDDNSGHSKQHMFAMFSKNRFLSHWLSTVTWSQTGARDESISIAPAGYTIRDKSDATMLQWENEINLGPAWTLTAGVDGRKERLDAYADYGFGSVARNEYDRTTSSVHLGLLGAIDAHQFQLNARYDRVGNAGSDVTGYFGYGFALTDQVKLIANASTAFNAPSLIQLYDPANGNPGLRSEKSRSYEVGAQYAQGATLLRATLFSTRIKDQFAVDPNNCFSGAYPASCPSFNFAQTENQGLELSARGEIADIDLQATLTRQDPRDKATGIGLLRRAKIMGSISASRAFGAWNMGVDASYTGSRPDRDFAAARDVQQGGYWLANLNTRYQVTKNVSVYGRIENVFDKNYQTTYGYDQAPRSVFVGVNWQL